MTKVILIEDDPTMISLLKTLLELEGFTVVSSLNAIKGDLIPGLIRENPDVVLMDVHLRHANGVEILQRLRKEPSLQHLKVLMTSGIDLKSKCIDEGADAFLLKPFMPDELVRLIRTDLAS